MQRFGARIRVLCERCPQCGRAGVDQAPLARLRIFQHHETRILKLRLAPIGYAHRHHVVLAIRTP